MTDKVEAALTIAELDARNLSTLSTKHTGNGKRKVSFQEPVAKKPKQATPFPRMLSREASHLLDVWQYDVVGPGSWAEALSRLESFKLTGMGHFELAPAGQCDAAGQPLPRSACASWTTGQQAGRPNPRPCPPSMWHEVVVKLYLSRPLFI